MTGTVYSHGDAPFFGGLVLASDAGMQCRIDVRRDGEHVVVHLAGDLTQEYVPTFLEACASEGARLVIELDDLLSADTVGVDALRRAEDRGALLVSLPYYLRLKLDLLERQQNPKSEIRNQKL